MVKIHPKPLSKKEWEFWDEILTNFIMEVESLIAITPEELLKRGDAMTDPFEAHLIGTVKGMWSIHKFMEERMVQDDESDKSVDTEEGEKVDERKGTLSEDHLKKLRVGIRRYWRNKRKGIKGKSIDIESKEGEKVDGRKGPLSADHMKNIKAGIRRYWRNKRKGINSKGDREPKKYSGLVIHRDLESSTKKRKKSGKLSSNDVLEVFESHDKRQQLQFTDLYKELQKLGKIPKTYNTEKYKQILSDRLYFLGNKGNLKATKQGHKNFYKLA